MLTRIKQYIDFKGIKIATFERSIGMSNASFGKSLRNNGAIGSDKLEKILSVYTDISPEWLLTGQGSMLKGELKEGVKTDSNYNSIPLVEQSAVAGFGNSNFAIAKEDIKEFYVVPKFKHRKVDFMIELSGNSMYPQYNSGDVVACTVIKESRFIQWNRVHVIATKEQGIMCKRLQQGTEGHIKAVSVNPD